MADLFDFLLAAVHEFDLRLFQSPTGQDVRAMATMQRGADSAVPTGKT